MRSVALQNDAINNGKEQKDMMISGNEKERERERESENQMYCRWTRRGMTKWPKGDIGVGEGGARQNKQGISDITLYSVNVLLRVWYPCAFR